MPTPARRTTGAAIAGVNVTVEIPPATDPVGGTPDVSTPSVPSAPSTPPPAADPGSPAAPPPRTAAPAVPGPVPAPTPTTGVAPPGPSASEPLLPRTGAELTSLVLVAVLLFALGALLLRQTLPTRSHRGAHR